MAAGRYHVTTCGFEQAPEEADEHIQIVHTDLPGKSWDLLLELKMYSAGYWLLPDVRHARKELRGKRFDVILANEINTLPLALSLRPACGVHADLHEYYPRMNEHHAPWKKRIGPWYHWLCRKYLPRASSATAVVDVVAKEYERVYGVSVSAVRNATPYQELEPTPVNSPIRAVHSGASERDRNVRGIVDAVIATPGWTLDLYLTRNDPGHIAELKEIARKEPRITVHDPVPYDELIQTLNQYDVGIHMLPPINYNFAHTLPNKIFDFLQARIAAVVSPTPAAMAAVVREANFGRVTEGTTAEDFAKVLAEYTPEEIALAKQSAHANAHKFSSESEVPKWDEALQHILIGKGVCPAKAPQ